MILVADCGGSKYELGLFDSTGKIVELISGKLQLDLHSDFNFFNDLKKISDNLKPSVVIFGIAGISRLSENYIKSLRKSIVEKTGTESIKIMSDVDLLRWMLDENGLGISVGTGSALIYNNHSGSQTLGGLGYLFNDYLSGWWWFQKFFEVSMFHLEGRSYHLGFEQDFLHLLSLNPERASLIKYVYSEPRNVLSAHASKMLAELADNSWVVKMADYGAEKLLDHVENFDIDSIYLQGGMVKNHTLIKNSIVEILYRKKIKCEVNMTDNLLLGGYRHWLKNQSI